MKRNTVIEREREFAAAQGLHKPDTLMQTLRCPECNHEVFRRVLHPAHAYESVDEVEERMLASVLGAVAAHCPECHHAGLRGDGAEQMFLCYAERAEAHLAVTLKLTHEDDGRTHVRRQIWLVPQQDDAVEIEPDAPFLEDVWTDARIRVACENPDPELRIDALRLLAEDLPSDALVLRELGLALLDVGQNVRALGAMQRSLQVEPNQPSILRRAGMLYTGYGDAGEGARLLGRAYELTGNPDVLPELIRAAYQARRLGALKVAADTLLRHDPESVLARKAVVAVESAIDIDSWRDRWRELAEAAGGAGERRTEQVANHWVGILDLPWPNWDPAWSADTYRRAIVETFVEYGYDVDTDPSPLRWREAMIPFELEVVDRQGVRYCVRLVESLLLPHVEQQLLVTWKALLSDTDRTDARAVVLSKQPMTYAAQRYASRASDVLLDLGADADTTMSVLDENVGPLVWAAEKHFGLALDFSLDSLEVVDHILDRYHDSGFGAMTYALQCQVASYVGEVMAACIEGAGWDDGDDEMDPRVFTFPDGAETNLVSKVGKAVRNGTEDNIQHFVSVLLDHVLTALSEGDE